MGGLGKEVQAGGIQDSKRVQARREVGGDQKNMASVE